MPSYLIVHRHEPSECRTAFAAWHGFRSPLRRRSTLASCNSGGHVLWWQVEASDGEAALALLPRWIAERSEVTRVDEVRIP